METPITIKEILQVQQEWGENLIEVGKKYRQNENYEEATINFVERFYAFDTHKVLFKPTLASLYQFRLTKESAKSYFMGGNPDYPRDEGFALQPWVSVSFENADFILLGNYALAMGNYFFTNQDGNVTKVEYSLGYIRSDEKLKLILHHSSLPFEPAGT